MDNHLRQLPPEVAVLILERLEGAALVRVPQVCRAWRDVFTRAAGAAYADSLACAVRQRYGLRVRVAPADGGGDGACAGELYLRLRGESCHLCPETTVLPFVYAASAALGPVPTLFPVCAACAAKQLVSKEFDVLVESQYASTLGVKCDGAVFDGALYSNARRHILCARLVAMPSQGGCAEVHN